VALVHRQRGAGNTFHVPGRTPSTVQKPERHHTGTINNWVFGAQQGATSPR